MDVELEGGGEAGGSWATGGAGSNRRELDPPACINDLREYDVNFYQRVAIDLDIRVGLWYTVRSLLGVLSLERLTDRVKRAEPVVMAFDIEVTKSPLKFPDQQVDQIMMISYMVDGQVRLRSAT